MKKTLLSFVCLVGCLWIVGATGAQAAQERVWHIGSPDHGQTFAYGSEQNRVWHAWGRDQHLALQLDYTNDPFVSRSEPRQYDNFIFNFPNIRLGKFDQVFYLHTNDGHNIPVAAKQDALLGTEIKLLPTAQVIVRKPHGYVTVTIVVYYSL